MQTYWIWLAQCPGLSPREKNLLLAHFEDVQSLYRADKGSLQPLGLKPKALEGLLNKDLAPIFHIQRICAQKGIGLLTYGDRAYPQRLRQLPDAPMVLYYLGKLPDLEELAAIAVVGTRKASHHGLNAARSITGELVRGGAGIVSGMAYGVDSAATTEALNQGGSVIGVLGCGIDVIYPASNRSLFYRMREHGCLISEYPPGTQPRQWYFPQRNRIISGLSLGTLVTEAPEKSGALITARAALDQNRDVFVVPGPDGCAACAGSNALLQQGAKPASCGWDILRTYHHRLPGRFRQAAPAQEKSWQAFSLFQGAPAFDASDKKSIDKAPAASYSVVENRPSLSPQAQAILEVLAQGEQEIDNVIAKAALEPSQALAVMTMLEMRGLICRPDSRRIALKK